MNELVKIETNENLEPIISGRELHEKLGVETKFQDWIKRMLEYGFTENVDFTRQNELTQKREGSRMVERNIEQYYLKLDTAKEICMLQRNEKGKMFRQYFIQVEKDYNSPEKIMARALMIADKKIKVLDVRIGELENKIEDDRPRVEFCRSLENASDCILIRDYSKILANENIKLGEKKFYKKLREWGYVFKNKTLPTQRAVEQGLLVLTENIIKTVKGDMLTKTTRITGKGQVFFLEKLKKEGILPMIEREEDEE